MENTNVQIGARNLNVANLSKMAEDAFVAKYLIAWADCDDMSRKTEAQRKDYLKAIYKQIKDAAPVVEKAEEKGKGNK